ncbi:trans-sulfuration enzyme family protein [Neolewinella antarctica]|uniref:Cystathionine gamma-synthase n=1 Tax=Neolewinella antarctica TaxID=442734 RepID=A0ABX0X9B7_9BACT|nr:aminotransferase class I/II-fold pyridoxal phosphate-dependent enzyme [Neolewinella antarctica]NJC25529.1 cystathionine gamma-synthase [Neolewinella antarctica]
MPKPVAQPVYLSTTYHREPDGSYADGYVYSRADNPNRRQLEGELAALEGGEAALAFASGMAAIHALFLSLKTGDHLLLPDDVYYNVRLLLDEVMHDWGLTYTAVDMTDQEAVRAAIRPSTRLIWLETPSNPQLKVTDIRAVVELAMSVGAKVAVDNTWPTPIHQRPFDLGADYVVHSTTKYFGGHSDVLGGCLIVKSVDDSWAKIKRIQHVGGAVPSPLDCYLVSRGLRTLRLRVLTQSASALALARYLEAHEQIERVIYPGLASHPQRAVAASQMENGYGAMLSVLVAGDAARANAVSHRLEHFSVATSLGGVESLVEHRKSVEGPASETPENLLRLSVGVEPVAELIADWEHALAR